MGLAMDTIMVMATDTTVVRQIVLERRGKVFQLACVSLASWLKPHELNARMFSTKWVASTTEPPIFSVEIYVQEPVKRYEHLTGYWGVCQFAGCPAMPARIPSIITSRPFWNEVSE